MFGHGVLGSVQTHISFSHASTPMSSGFGEDVFPLSHEYSDEEACTGWPTHSAADADARVSLFARGGWIRVDNRVIGSQPLALSRSGDLAEAGASRFKALTARILAHSSLMASMAFDGV